MHDDSIPFREPARARRIRDRERMARRGAMIAARMHGYDRPGGEFGSGFLWTDIGHRERRGVPTWADVFDLRASWGRHNRDHLAACSCHMCGNPRRHFGQRTPQEARADDAARDQADTVGGVQRRRWRPGWW